MRPIKCGRSEMKMVFEIMWVSIDQRSMEGSFVLKLIEGQAEGDTRHQSDMSAESTTLPDTNVWGKPSRSDSGTMRSCAMPHAAIAFR